ncbi:uncharacterized protein UV8b_03679 [Ustilaginoidea virens]|uniref:Rab-GAP TBC domain-containing protein n=1 Tax=Ustilaginoidea virens TaxID=1159556 RepID=A0A8E5HQ83_USTVR|nr:uncharacterized protein UV8b_03679 [Ustilaginoidea virens]QUC19438.1 hypothetical protein UV8b_03679 [Ustilaginoidea virens]
MRSLEETQSRWQITHDIISSSLQDLRLAVKCNGLSSPCLSGCRSVCWKAFLLSSVDSAKSWEQALEQGRKDYQKHREYFLRYIQHPEALAELAVDPLTDDPESPWNAVRQDEIVRSEIQQDVQRLPDEANYHEQRVQGMILDVLFVYCKINPDRGGYRQGMHELLAPLVYVLEQDSVDSGSLGDASGLDQTMLGVLDASLVEHDAFILFSRLMEPAQSFYQVSGATAPSQLGTPTGISQEQRSAIVDRSKYIHEYCLQKVDPELATHLSNIEILPQIFLIRWIRLLFSREFPLNQLLVLWDTIFAVDPSLKLIDLVCVSMLVRVRWQLLEADYSVCLQLLLKYPAPEQPHGPHTFIEDAVYLRDHLDQAGGSSLILKYSGKMPEVPNNTKPGPAKGIGHESKPSRPGGIGARLALASPPRIVQQQAGMENFLHGAAKGAISVLERSEKLGINQAVRDAVGEIRRNVQSFNEARQAQRFTRIIMPNDEEASKSVIAMEQRNKQLASLLNDTVSNLKAVMMSNLDDKAKSLELIEMAAAKIQFVQTHLEGSTMGVPASSSQETSATLPSPESMTKAAKNAADGKGLVSTDMAANKKPSTSTQPEGAPADIAKASAKDDKVAGSSRDVAKAIDTGRGAEQADQPGAKTEIQAYPPRGLDDPKEGDSAQKRPVPVPTRSTLAQSSFSWMLEPDESTSSRASSGPGAKSPPTQHKKRSSNNMSRQRNAFLFGEETAAEEGSATLKSDDIFGMEPISKPKVTLQKAVFDDK